MRTKNSVAKIPSKNRDDLFLAISRLKTADRIGRFLEDLCTPAEIDSMADRWQVAQLLVQNVPYRTIYEKTGTSTATVTRVARALKTGQGYRGLLK